ncbi:MAG: class I SAM-dependent methyltransferase [Selenomonadaceae bacterium]|nr:class I SAM-dependent methyltransferase [Selenomonadaceae bacterium]
MDSNQAHAGEQAYDENFYRGRRKAGLYKSAAEVLSVVGRFIHPRTVIDLGCGTGEWLAAWQNLFGTEIFGVDGDYVDRSQLSVDEKFFHPFNLEERVNLNRRFDLVESLEVAEHLSPARADSFVEDLTRLGDVILFSAAIPAQGGTNHVNEQWQSYWAQKFLRLNYVAVDCIRPEIWDNKNIWAHYCQNILIYVKGSELYRYPELHDFYLKHRDSTIYDVVHPITFFIKINEFKNFYQRVQEQLSNQK